MAQVSIGQTFTLEPFNVHMYGGAPAYDDATQAWIDAVVADGGSVSETRATLINTMIATLKTAGAWEKIDRLWMPSLGDEDSHQPFIDLTLQDDTVHKWTNHGLTFDTGGYLGDGASTYGDLGWYPDGNHNWVAGSAFGGIATQVAGLSAGRDIGENNSFEICPSSQLGCIINCDGSFIGVQDTSKAIYSYLRYSTADHTINCFKNGARYSYDQGAVQNTMPGQNFLFGCVNQFGSPGLFAANRYSALWCGGGGATDAHIIAIDNAINVVLTALGAGLY